MSSDDGSDSDFGEAGMETIRIQDLNGRWRDSRDGFVNTFDGVAKFDQGRGEGMPVEQHGDTVTIGKWQAVPAHSASDEIRWFVPEGEDFGAIKKWYYECRILGKIAGTDEYLLDEGAIDVSNIITTRTRRTRTPVDYQAADQLMREQQQQQQQQRTQSRRRRRLSRGGQRATDDDDDEVWDTSMSSLANTGLKPHEIAQLPQRVFRMPKKPVTDTAAATPAAAPVALADPKEERARGGREGGQKEGGEGSSKGKTKRKLRAVGAEAVEGEEQGKREDCHLNKKPKKAAAAVGSVAGEGAMESSRQSATESASDSNTPGVANISTSTKSNSLKHDEEAGDFSCSICLNDFIEGDALRTLPCFHCFHAHCLDPWLRANRSCPLCKLELAKSLFRWLPTPS